MKLLLTAVLLAMVLAVPAVAFNGEWLITLKWVPADGTNVLDINDELDGLGVNYADAVVVYSASDMEIAVGHRRSAYNATTAQAAITTVLGDAVTFPAAGKTVQGSIKWLASTAVAGTDTIYVDCYKRLAWPR